MKIIARCNSDHIPFDRDGKHATGYEVLFENGVWDYEYEGDEYEYVPNIITYDWADTDTDVSDFWDGIHCTLNGAVADSEVRDKMFRIWIVCEYAPADYIVPDWIIEQFFGEFYDFALVQNREELWLYLFNEDGENTTYFHLWEAYSEED